MNITKLLKIVFGIVLLAIVFTFYSLYGIISFGKYNHLVKADAAIVLGTEVLGDEPSPVLKERLNHAIWLYEEGYVGKIIFTGGKTNGSEVAESEVSRNYAIKHLVNPKDVLIETESKITEQNFKFAKEIAEQNGFHTFIIVSDPFHMKRAMFMAKSQGLVAYSSPTQTSFYKGLKDGIPFLVREMIFYYGYLIVSYFR